MAGRCRVLYLLPTLIIGGAERVVVEHLRRLPRDRFELELAAFDAAGLSRELLPEDVAVHELRATGPSRLLARRRALRTLLAERRFDVVSSHLSAANVVNLAEAAGSPAHAARVVTVHADPRGIAMGWRRRFAQRLQKALARRADRIVFLLHDTADVAARAYGARPEQVAVIPNGVDPGELRALADRGTPLAWPAPGLHLAAFGRLTAQKGFDYLLRALAIARAKGLEASLVIISEGAERAALERLRGQLGLDGVVAMPGYLENPYPTLRAADLFVLSSRFEGFALVVLEALALGRPVLAANCPAGPGELLAGDVGMLVPPRDPEALAAGLLELGRSPERRAELAGRGPARAEEYHWAHAVEKTAEMLLAVAEERRR